MLFDIPERKRILTRFPCVDGRIILKEKFKKQVLCVCVLNKFVSLTLLSISRLL
jgi:hypothetical protein